MADDNGGASRLDYRALAHFLALSECWHRGSHKNATDTRAAMLCSALINLALAAARGRLYDARLATAAY
jgi:hypothetical protein